MASNNTSKEQIRLLKEAQALGKALGLEYDNIAGIQDEILRGHVKTNEQLLRELKEQRQIKDEIQAQSIAEQEKATALEDYASILQSTLKPLSKIKNMTEQSLQAEKEKIEKAVRANAIQRDTAAGLLKQLDTFNKLAKNPVVKSGFAAAADTIDGMQSSIDSLLSKLPGGEFLSKALGLDRLGEKLQNAIMGGARLGVVGLVAVLGTAFAILKSITDEANKFAEATGVTFGQARGIADQSKITASSLDIQLATSQDILAVQQSTITEFGNMAMLSTEVAAQVADIGKSFGYGAQQAAAVNNQFISMGMSGKDAASAQEELAANALKAGVNVGTVMKDITANAKQASKYFGGNVKALAAAAVQAAKLGISIQDMTSLADKLLDIEGSLQNQFELQAMTGKQINLDKARELALEGKIAEASQSVYEQIGGIAEFDRMRPLERKKLAEMMGMEVSELEKSLAIQEQMKGLTEDEMAAAMNLGLSAAEIRDMDAAQLKDKLAQQQSLEKANQSISAMKDEMMMALVPLAETLGAVFGTLAPLLKIAFTPLIWAGEAMKAMIDFAKEYSIITSVILGTLGLIWAGQKAALITETAKNIQYEIGFFWLQAQEGIEAVKLAIQNASLTTIIAQGAAMVANTAKAIYEGAVVLAKAVAGIFSSFAMIPFGIGIPLAIAAVGGLMSMFSSAKQTGDLAMGANGGPIVANPREGTIFQGTNNDEIAMGPGVINAAQSNGTTVVQQSSGVDNSLLQTMISELQAIKVALGTPVPVQIGDRVITEIGTQLAVNKTYRTGVGGR